MSMPIRTTTGELVKLGAEALGRDQIQFLKEVSNFVKPSGSGDSDPNRETLLSYSRTPTTRCGYKFAGMVLDFLYANRREVKNEKMLDKAVLICRTVLRQNQQKRYQHPPRTNPASVHRIEKIAGVYLLIRRATSDQTLRQELLILANEGLGDRNLYATYVNPGLVCRGMWCVVRDTASSIMSGYRGNYGRPDAINFHLLYEEPESEHQSVFLSGFASGITSQTAEPAVVPVIAISILDNKISKKKDILQIGNGGDAEVRNSWRLVAEHKSETIEQIGDILDHAVDPKNGALIRHAGDISGKIRQIVGRIETLVPDKICTFCNDFTIGHAWNI
jgi:hypothetical protein